MWYIQIFYFLEKYYFHNLVSQLEYNASCDRLNTCNNNLNLICNDSVCSCRDTTFWNGTGCGNVKQGGFAVDFMSTDFI